MKIFSKNGETGYWRGAALVSLVYLALYAVFLIFTDGLPYVMDNNESFSSFIHAENMYQFGFFETYGLTDESANPDIKNPAAHPFVHTHQGNFPRFFSLLLYALGARSVELQIIITTLTMGWVTILLAYYFVAKITSPLFSIITCLVMMTDYVMFAQWQVNTYRIWYGFFFFSTLCCVHGMGGKHGRWFPWLMGLNFLCIFYWEFVYASFLWALAVVYALFLYRRQWGVFWKGVAGQSIGAVLAIGILFIQLALYMGVENVFKDAYYTISARNFVNDPEQLTIVQKFYEDLNIAFFLNFMNSEGIKSPDWFLSSFLKYHFVVYTPYLILIFGFLTSGWLIDYLFEKSELDKRWRRWGRTRPRKVGEGADALILQLTNGLRKIFIRWVTFSKSFLLWAGCFVLLYASWVDASALGVQRNFWNPFFLWKKPFMLLLAGGVSFLILFVVSKISRRSAYWNLPRVAVALVVLMIGAYWVRIQGLLYSQELTAIWIKMVDSWLAWIVYPALPVSIGIFLAFVLDGEKGFLKKMRKQLDPIWIFLLCVMIGNGVAWFWAAGYLYSGYLVRWCPFSSFAFYLLIALGVYTPLAMLVYLKGRIEKSWTDIKNLIRNFVCPEHSFQRTFLIRRRFEAGTVCIAGLFLLGMIAFLTLYWGKLQTLYVKYLPPTHAQFLKKLRKEPFQDASFISNNYALPVSHMTRKWAYCVPDSVSNYLVSPIKGSEALRRSTFYQWFADRRQNLDYAKPQYFLYFGLQHHLNVVNQRILLEQEKKQKKKQHNWGNKFVEFAIQNEDRSNTYFQVIDKDPEPWKTWAVVRLNWPFLPYLDSFSGTDEKTSIFLTRLESEKKAENRKKDYHVMLKFESALHRTVKGKFCVKIWKTDWSGKKSLDEKIFELEENSNWLDFSTSTSLIKIKILQIPTAGHLLVFLDEKAFSFDLEESGMMEIPLFFDLEKGNLLKEKKRSAAKSEEKSSSVLQGHYINYHVVYKNGDVQIRPLYQYRHPENKQEEKSILKLYEVLDKTTWKELKKNSDERKFSLPENFKGKVCISVTPRGGGKEGMEYFGPVLEIPYLSEH